MKIYFNNEKQLKSNVMKENWCYATGRDKILTVPKI